MGKRPKNDEMMRDIKVVRTLYYGCSYDRPICSLFTSRSSSNSLAASKVHQMRFLLVKKGGGSAGVEGGGGWGVVTQGIGHCSVDR